MKMEPVYYYAPHLQSDCEQKHIDIQKTFHLAIGKKVNNPHSLHHKVVRQPPLLVAKPTYFVVNIVVECG
jgi:hypothetical protein